MSPSDTEQACPSVHAEFCMTLAFCLCMADDMLCITLQDNRMAGT